MKAAAALLALLLSAAAGAESLHPSPDQLQSLRGLGLEGEVALVELLQVRDADAFARHRAAGEARLRELGGRRVYSGALDRPSTGDARMRFDALVVDVFPSSDASIDSLERPIEGLEDAVADRVAIAMVPGSAAFLTGVRWASKAVHFVAGREIQDAPPPPAAALGGAGDGAEALAELLTAANERDSLIVFNINQYRSRASYRSGDPERDTSVDGETAYHRYGTNTAPQLAQRGAYPVWSGTPRVLVVGQADDVFAGHWDEFLLVSYPSRLAMRDMFNDPAYQEGLFHRSAGIERAIVLPGTPDPAFDPR